MYSRAVARRKIRTLPGRDAPSSHGDTEPPLHFIVQPKMNVAQFPPSAYVDLAQNHRDALQYPQEDRFFLEPYLPVSESFQQHIPSQNSLYPWTTLTYATSLDAAIAAAPGTQTVLSGAQSKAMTHYLRARHDGILIGIGTALADNPSLNCRLLGVGGYGGHKLNRQPRPIIVDPHGKFLEVLENSKVKRLAHEGKGRGPWLVMPWTDEPSVLRKARQMDDLLESVDGKVLLVQQEHPRSDGKLSWMDILHALKREGLENLMIEGGATIINDLLRPENHDLINSVIITIAPTWLGSGGVVVAPQRTANSQDGKVSSIARLKAPIWHQLGDDVVVAGRLQ